MTKKKKKKNDRFWVRMSPSSPDTGQWKRLSEMISPGKQEEKPLYCSTNEDSK